ncbi:type II toxin-antitoxin system VapC family toxin, partial [Patescibacteria group bacterium]|nr:type II toxin-antitoxin system VapC family toxin [Patescibacteria group bacterium]
MDEDKKEEQKEESGIYILLDTSVLFAYVHEKDAHHLSVESALGAIKPYKPRICIPSVVLLETMGKLIREGKKSVAQAKKILEDKLKEFDTRFEHRSINHKIILDRYKGYSKSDVSKLKAIDFYIVVEAISISACLLTCDKEMYEKTKSKHKKIFYLGDNTKTQLPKLIKEVEKEFHGIKKPS